ncbi:MAG: hypothetical protein ACK42D_01660 [Candidatus Paceibacteria bacterium]
MLTVFYGNDTVAVRGEAMKLLDSYVEEGFDVARYSSEQYSQGLVENLLQADSLFGGKEVAVFDTPSENSDFYEAVISLVAELVASPLPFVIIEQSLTAAQLRPFAKVEATMQECKKVKNDYFNVFALADSLLAKDKKTLWILLQEARRNEIPTEELIGILWWQLKMLRLTFVTTSASEAGVKDFPYNKAKRGQSKYTKEEVDTLSLSLLEVYHDGHGGRRDIVSALEGWLLNI